MKKITIWSAATAIIFSLASASAEEYSKPIFIKGSDATFSAYPGSEVNMARTARVWVSFMVKKDGTVFEPMIEQINNDRFSRNVLKWVRLRDYEPAEVDGKPVDSWTRQRFKFNMAYNENSAFVSTKLFNKHYKNFGDEIAKENPNRKKLEKWLKKMAGSKHGSPLAYEFLSSARYKFAAKFLDSNAQVLALKEMILSNDKGLAMANGQAADIELLKLGIENGYYGEVLENYYAALSKHSSAVDAVLKNTFEPTISQIEEIMRTEKAFARSIKIDAAGYVFMPLSKRAFAIEKVNGALSSLKLRCKRRFAELKFNADSEYQIPESWGECQLQISGSAGAAAQLIQY